MFTKFLNKQKNQPALDAPLGASANLTTVPLKQNTSVDDSVLPPPAAIEQPRRRWSYVTYLNQGTLHGDGDNLMVGL